MAGAERGREGGAGSGGERETAPEELRGPVVFRISELDSIPGIFHLFLGRTSDGGPAEAKEGDLFPDPFRPERIVRLRQVHAARVVSAMGADGGAPRQIVEADGAITDVPGLLLCVGVADCMPVYLVDPERPAIALLHAGWRGLAAGVIEAGLAAFEERGLGAGNLLAAIGPSIGPCCYEVGEEVAARLGTGARPTPGPSGRLRADLYGDARARLIRGGVSEERIAARPPCTSCRRDSFHSHRGSGGLPGRNEAFLGIFP